MVRAASRIRACRYVRLLGERVRRRSAQQNGVAFTVDADSFISFARSLPCGIDNPDGERLMLSDLIDFDLCWAFNLVDPWGNQYELNCYAYERVKTELVEADGVSAERYWPRELYAAYRDRAP